jgi:hypothetical protein
MPIYGGTAAIFGGSSILYIFLIFGWSLLVHFGGATWCLPIGPCGILLIFPPVYHLHVTLGHVAPSGWCHVASPGGATWHFFTGPHGTLKSPNLSDTWQPLVLPCGMMMSS